MNIMPIKQWVKNHGFSPEDLPYEIRPEWESFPICECIRKWEKHYNVKYGEGLK